MPNVSFAPHEGTRYWRRAFVGFLTKAGDGLWGIPYSSEPLTSKVLQALGPPL